MMYKQKYINGGTQVLHYFPNGFGASVVRHEFSYGGAEGLFELAVLDWNSNPFEDPQAEFSICYDTVITSDVLGHLTEEDVEDLLKQIEEL